MKFISFGQEAKDSEDSSMASPSKGCNTFLQESDRARAQWQLEADFAEFETLPWLR